MARKEYLTSAEVRLMRFAVITTTLRVRAKICSLVVFMVSQCGRQVALPVEVGLLKVLGQPPMLLTSHRQRAERAEEDPDWRLFSMRSRQFCNQRKTIDFVVLVGSGREDVLASHLQRVSTALTEQL